MFLPRLDWTSWGCRCTNSTLSKSFKFTVRTWVLLMLKNANIWNMNCLPVSIGHLFFCWVSSEKLIFLLKSAWIIFIIPLAIFESRVSNSNRCLSNTNLQWSNSSILGATSISPNHLLTYRSRPWHHFSARLSKILSKNRINTPAAKVQIRISLLLSFLVNFHRQLIACLIEQDKSMEYVPMGCLLRVVMSVMVNQPFLTAWRVANNPFLAVPPAILFVLCSAISWALITSCLSLFVFQVLEALGNVLLLNFSFL